MGVAGSGAEAEAEAEAGAGVGSLICRRREVGCRCGEHNGRRKGLELRGEIVISKFAIVLLEGARGGGRQRGGERTILGQRKDSQRSWMGVTQSEHPELWCYSSAKSGSLKANRVPPMPACRYWWLT